MKTVYFTIIIQALFIGNVCAQLKNDRKMVEKFNYEATEGGTKYVSFKQGDWIIDIRPVIAQYEYAPAKDFYEIQKLFHKNGMIASRGKFLGHVSFGIWEYFDENGNLTKEVDEDAKFGKIKPKDIVRIMEDVGWINRKTGATILSDTLLSTDGFFYKKVFVLSNGRNFQIYFNPAQFSEKGEEIHPPQWLFGYSDDPIYVEYRVDGNTGEYEYFETYQMKYE
jgi:hypothetical protein